MICRPSFRKWKNRTYACRSRYNKRLASGDRAAGGSRQTPPRSGRSPSPGKRTPRQASTVQKCEKFVKIIKKWVNMAPMRQVTKRADPPPPSSDTYSFSPQVFFHSYFKLLFGEMRNRNWSNIDGIKSFFVILRSYWKQSAYSLELGVEERIPMNI